MKALCAAQQFRFKGWFALSGIQGIQPFRTAAVAHAQRHGNFAFALPKGLGAAAA
jgi:hypothetical protein